VGSSSPSSEPFSNAVAKRYWLYCRASSSAKIATISSWTCPYCVSSAVKGFKVTKIITDSSTQTLAYVGYSTSNKEIIAVFRGTETSTNWLLDLEAWHTDRPIDGIPNAITATGFHTVYKALRSGVYNAVLAARKSYPNYAIKILGHSLGGAVASITALDFAYLGRLPVQCFTFGSPRVGDSGFVSAFEKYVSVYWRMTHNNDPVPHVPFTLLGFKHLNHEIFEHGNGIGSFTICDPNANESPKCADQYEFWLFQMAWTQHTSYMGIASPPK